jgi:hypothetical protein
VDLLFQVPIDVAVEEPRARVVSHEPDRDIIGFDAYVHDVAYDGVVEVVRRTSCAANDVEGMPMQVDRMLFKDAEAWRSVTMAQTL